jgi:hypothetical protein
MPIMDPDPEGTEIARPRRIGITPGDCHPSATGDERESAHPGPADSHEVDRTRIRGVEQVHDGLS